MTSPTDLLSTIICSMCTLLKQTLDRDSTQWGFCPTARQEICIKFTYWLAVGPPKRDANLGWGGRDYLDFD
jgi:hypothetical protein